MSENTPLATVSGPFQAQAQTDDADIVRLSEITRNTAITIQTSEQAIALSVADVLKWVAPEAPENEALKFLMVCRARGLNPLLGEAHLVPFGPKWQTVVDKSGYLKLMEEHPMYAGHEAGIIVREWDAVAKKPVGDERYLNGSYRPKECLLVGGWARVYRKDRRTPTYVTISAEEYNKGTGSYLTIPCTMLRKVALVHAAGESGLINAPRGYLADEAPKAIWADHPEPIEHSSERLEQEYSHAREDANLPASYLDRIIKLRDRLGIPEDSFEWRDALARRGVGHAAELTVPNATDLISKLSSFLPHPDLADDSDDSKIDVEFEIKPNIEDGEAFELPGFSRAPKKGEANGEAIPATQVIEPELISH